ncbi:glycosyltransferase [Solwaraspora sp. WMMD406]|uniref:glycosyltransferase n=1 Tax=Solwaraspora sp. WMMD406 TaxID=3016095 RepID=UPI002417243B|nr:glycosyltransferase [Solwaraspora sp. WMMD406]MDG4762601.1 glycosyltransferase [Solwaraspora sp. WMMD406]
MSSSVAGVRTADHRAPRRTHPTTVPAAAGPAAVVVCVHTPERLAVIRRCLDAATRQLDPDHDQLVVVVDHHDELLRLLRSAVPTATVVANVGERGLSGARNTGIAATTAPVVIFLDDDAVPGPGWLAAWRRIFTDPTVMMAGGAVRPDWADGRAPRWFPDEYGWVVGCDYRGIGAAGTPVRNPIGANMAIRRDALNQVGDFSVRLGRVAAVPSGCEETELGIRVGRAYGPAAVVRFDEPTVDHRVPATRATVGYFLSRCHHEGRSKAVLSAAVGRTSSLSAERRYALRTLPAAVARHFVAVVRGDLAGPARATMTVLGLFATAGGYLVGLRANRKRAATAAHPEDRPMAVVEVELAGTAGRDLAVPAAAASVLIRFRGLPVGRVVLPPRVTANGPAVLERAVERGLGPALRVHLDRAGVPVPSAATPDELLRLARASAPAASDEHAVASGQPLVSVVLCTLGTEARLPAAVAAILAQTYRDLELIVVDNDPVSDRVRHRLADVDDPRVRIVAQPRRGLSRARNAGLAAASGDIVAFTDDDALPDVHWLAEAIRGFAVDPAVGCVTGLVTPARLDTRWERLFEEYGAFDKGYLAKVWSVRPVPPRLAHAAQIGDRGPLFPYVAGNYGSGNNMAFRAEVLRELAGFDPALGAGSPTRGGEDLDMFRAVLTAGHAILYVPSALVRHFHRDSRPALRRQLFGYGSGFTAVAFKQLVSGWSAALRIMRSSPKALRVVVDPQSPKYAGRSPDFPLALSCAEFAGYLAGPWLLLWGRVRARWRR